MTAHTIHLARTRNRLSPRREPYWGAPIEHGLFLGFRKLDDGGGTWVARAFVDGKHRYRSLGRIEGQSHDEAVKASRAWAKSSRMGVDTSEVQTVADACREYVEDRRQEKGDANADDANGRFTRTVYGHAIGEVKLTKLRAKHVKDWRAGLTKVQGKRGKKRNERESMSDASKNRYLATLKAALNYAATSRYVEASRAIEWESVKPVQVRQRRDLYLDRDQRHALIEALPDHARPFVRLLCLLPLRAGALAAATVADLDIKRASLRIRKDKAGAGRVIALSPDALDVLKKQSKGKLPGAPLVSYMDGSHWHKERWKQPIKKAAAVAELPHGVCAYTFRHSLITDMLVGGIDSLTVAKMAGTSIAMIEKHYGHLLHKHAADAMEKLAL